MSEAYTEDNLLDRLSDPATLAEQYERGKRRERELLDRHLGLAGGDAISIGCGWHPGRHLLPAPQWRLVAVGHRRRPHAHRRRAGRRRRGRRRRGRRARRARATARSTSSCTGSSCTTSPIAGPLEPCLREAHRLLRPGGALVAIEPNLFHPVGAALALANRAGLGVKVHGTPDDIPLSPRRLAAAARAAGPASPQLHAVSYSWRRLPRRVQRAVGALDRFGSAPGLRWAGHTFMLIARASARVGADRRAGLALPA